MHAATGLGTPIATGRTAEVFEWRSGTVIKLLRPGFEAAAGEERRAAERVTALGLAAPRFFGTEAVEGRPGLVYERVDGRSMVEAIGRDLRGSARLAGVLAELHVGMHDQSGVGLPQARAEVAAAIRRAESNLGPETSRAALSRLDALPDDTALLHGDFHPGNVVMSDRGPVVIDWLTAAAGPAAGDVARTLFLLRDSALGDDIGGWRRLVIRVVRRRFADAYLRRYRDLRPQHVEEVGAWRLPILAARAAERVEHEAPVLERLIQQELRRGV